MVIADLQADADRNDHVGDQCKQSQKQRHDGTNEPRRNPARTDEDRHDERALHAA